MPRIIEKTVFKFEELSDDAKEVARNWWREASAGDEWWEYVYEDAARVGEILGINLLQKPVKLMNGTTRYDPSIWFTGFYHQGSGSAFDGTYRYAKGSVAAIKKHAPLDKDLHRIADDMATAQKFYFYRLRATIKSRRDNWVDIEVYDSNDIYGPIQAQVDDLLTQALRDFNGWIFSQLEKEYEYQMSDEQVDESIMANEYEFDEEGNCA